MSHSFKVLSRLIIAILIGLLLAGCGSSVSQQPQEENSSDSLTPTFTEIVIDGEGDDWINRPLLSEDSSGDAEGDFLDIGKVYAFLNQDSLYVLIEVANPGADFEQFDFDISADGQNHLITWHKSFDQFGKFGHSEFFSGTVVEGKIDLDDIGSPEGNVVISQIRVMAGDPPPSDSWRSVDTFDPKLQYLAWANEVDIVEQPSTADLDSPPQNANPESTAAEPKEPRVNFTTSGFITEDEIWRGEIHITGDIQFSNGAALTLEPGTIVFIASNSDDRHANDTDGCFDWVTCEYDDPTLRVGWGANTISIDGRGGTIIAEGIPGQPIVFRPEGESESAGQYGGILIEKGTLKYSKILNGSGMQILGTPGEVEVAHNEIRGCVITCIDVHKDNAWVHHNVLEGGGHQTIGIQANDALIEHNIVLRGNLGINVEGIDEIGAKNIIVRNNFVVDTRNGISLHGENVQAINNTIVHIEGPPDWIYYQGEPVYPVKDSWLAKTGLSVGGNETTALIINNIVSGDFAEGIMVPQELGEGSLIDYNLFWGVNSTISDSTLAAVKENNLNADPLFQDLRGRNLRLSPESPCIDSGWLEILDPDGSPSDLGAYGGPYGDAWD